MGQRRFVEIAVATAGFPDLVFEAHQLVNFHAADTPGDADAIEMTPFEIGPGMFAHVAADEDLRAVNLVEIFEPAGHVDHIAEDGVGQAFRRADIADENVAAMQPDAGAE